MSLAHKPSVVINTSQQQFAVIKEEMSLFEGGGARGQFLNIVYISLLSVPPTSAESERAFSSAGSVCTKLRTRLSDKTLNELEFLRAYFRKIQLQTKSATAVDSC